MDYFNENRTTENCWASTDEIISSLHRIPLNNFTSSFGGIPIYTDSEAVYIEHTDIHSLIVGSTGSKKTRLVGMPALQTYAISGESFIATDPKGELYKKTYKILKDNDYRIFVLNLRNPLKSNSWNPLKIPYMLYHNGEEDKARELVIDMASTIAKTGAAREPYWENSAADLLAGLILLLIEYANENEINFKSLHVLRTQSLKNIEKNETYMQKYFLKYLEKTSFLSSFLSGTVDLNEESRSCIISEFDQAMSPFFSQDNLIDMLSENEIDFSEIGKTKTAVFLIIPDENTIYNKLISLFIKQCYSELIREAEKYPNNSLPKRVNFLLDEFSNLPAIKDFHAMITASRSRNIRFNLFIQGESQLIDRYGKSSDTIMANCNNWIYLYSHEYPFMEKLVRMAGKKTKNEPLISISMLQSLNKEKGEAYLRHNRNRPFITNLLDIDKYPNIGQGEENIQYPENNNKTSAVFNFEECCAFMNSDGDIFPEPIFTTKVTTDEEIEEISMREKMETLPETEPPIEHYAAGVGQGWYGLLKPIFEEINLYNKKNKGNEIQIDQIKQKFGSLRFYVSNCPNYLENMISIAEEESNHICEFCGVRGETVEINNWYSTLCPHHVEAKKAADGSFYSTSKHYRMLMDKYKIGK